MAMAIKDLVRAPMDGPGGTCPAARRKLEPRQKFAWVLFVYPEYPRAARRNLTPERRDAITVFEHLCAAATKIKENGASSKVNKLSKSARWYLRSVRPVVE
jgi:hypothetical protein